MLRNEDTYEDRSKGQSWDASRAHAGRQSNIVINRSRPMDRSRYTNPGTVKFTWWIVLTIIMIYVGSVDPRNTKVLAGLLIFLRRTLHFGPQHPLPPPPPAAGAASSPTLERPITIQLPPLFCAAASWQKSRKFLRRSRNYNYLSGLCGMQWVDT